jgi:hypothetical protein
MNSEFTKNDHQNNAINSLINIVLDSNELEDAILSDLKDDSEIDLSKVKTELFFLKTCDVVLAIDQVVSDKDYRDKLLEIYYQKLDEKYPLQENDFLTNSDEPLKNYYGIVHHVDSESLAESLGKYFAKRAGDEFHQKLILLGASISAAIFQGVFQMFGIKNQIKEN